MQLLFKSVAALALVVAASGAFAQDKSTVTVGVTVGNSEEIFKVVSKVAERDGLTVKVVTFNDYQLPNAALDAGDLDANSFQHQPFLDAQIKQRGYKLTTVGYTFTAPLAYYSRKVKSLNDLKEGASVGVQNDPSNGNRALLLLQQFGLIKLSPEAVKNGNATPRDVIENPKKLKLIPLDAAQLPRSLDDLDAAAINNDFAFKAGLSASKDGIAVEDAKSPYANIIVVRTEDKDKPWAKKLVAAYNSPEVKTFMAEKYKGSLIPAW
ncbi:MetQ/NlpA family lipoprotein [Pigmentiphaga aceris]|uniref:Lipoprotein n=1 Tax=Pigmentiphaga aceris TaxID=1940612 RepID=A0A5C0B153_9BURK|nr:MetQ/NlpA family lipoprotein [Pigmentiphaga aceris]QEI07706.1 MetQ/NlpA family lipoprotein [Pigmentiphaga aceris]